MVFNKTRFAPSPTGYMHLGNARTALFSLFAGQTFVLRIEDTDHQRSQSIYVEALLEDLRWLGIHWHEGPELHHDQMYYQSARTLVYQKYLAQLTEAGFAYPCFCSPDVLAETRKRQLALGRPPRYPGTCSRLTSEQIASRIAHGDTPSYRFRVSAESEIVFEDLVKGPQSFHGKDIGDFVIQRSDATPSFFFSNAVDDALMGINLVIRGEDHLSNTPRQLMLMSALSLPQPKYGHIALILGHDGAPLSKRNGSQSVRELREAGYFPEAVLNALARLGHHYSEDKLLGMDELRALFSIKNLSRSPARYDPQHLMHWQHLCMRELDETRLFEALPPLIQSTLPSAMRHDFMDMVRHQCEFPSDAIIWFEILTRPVPDMHEAAVQVIRQCSPAWFDAVDRSLEVATDFKSFIHELKQTGESQGKALFMPLRAMLSGRTDGPELARLFSMLSRQQVLDRLSHCRAINGGKHADL